MAASLNEEAFKLIRSCQRGDLNAVQRSLRSLQADTTDWVSNSASHERTAQYEDREYQINHDIF